MLQGKKHFRLLTLRSKVLSLPQRIVYSYLAYRARWGKSASKSSISRDTALDRGKTVPNALEKLQVLGLVTVADGKWTALEPTEGLLIPITGGEHWSQCFAYVWFAPLAADAPLTTAANVLLWTLVSLGATPQTLTGLAKMTGVGRVAVRTALLKLMDLGVANETPVGERSRFVVNPPAEWYVDSPKKLMGKREQHVRDRLTKFKVPASLQTRLVPALVKAPDPDAIIRRAWEGHAKWCKDRGRPLSHPGYRLMIDLKLKLDKDK